MEGGAGNDRVIATALSSSATLVFDGNGGRNVVRGGKGDNVYDFDGLGTLSITNAYAGGSAAHGTLAFGSGLSDQDLWLVRSGSNLVVEVIGTRADVTLSGWYASSASAKVTEITADGLELDAGVQKLVAAMASYQKADPAFNPTAAGATMPTASALQSAITANWHG